MKHIVNFLLNDRTYVLAAVIAAAYEIHVQQYVIAYLFTVSAALTYHRSITK